MKDLISSCIDDKMQEIKQATTKRTKTKKTKKPLKSKTSSLNSSTVTNSTFSTRLKSKKTSPTTTPIIQTPKPAPVQTKKEEENNLIEYISKLREERENNGSMNVSVDLSKDPSIAAETSTISEHILSPELSLSENLKTKFKKNSLDEDIINLEHEFDELTQRYDHIINGLSANSTSFYPFSHDDFSSQESTQNHADYIVKTIHDIHDTKEKLKKLQDIKSAQSI